MIRALITIVYLYGLLPLIIGLAVSLCINRHFRLSFIYVAGYVIYLSVFSIIVLWLTHKNVTYMIIARCWKHAVYFITIITLPLIIIVLLLRHKERNKKTDKAKHKTHSWHVSSESLFTIALTISLTIVSILFLVPNAFDETPELARLTLSSGSVFSINPASGTAYSDNSSLPGCLHLFYAVGSTLTDVNVVTLIHLIMPVFMIPLFICSYNTIAVLLFPRKEQYKNRYHFLWLIVLFYTLMLLLESHIALVPYRNIWNGITFASSCLFPLLFAVCIDLARKYSQNETSLTNTTVLSSFESIISIVLLIVSIRLCVTFGFIISGLFITATCIIIACYYFSRKRGEQA